MRIYTIQKFFLGEGLKVKYGRFSAAHKISSCMVYTFRFLFIFINTKKVGLSQVRTIFKATSFLAG